MEHGAAAGAELEGIGLDGTSGHSTWRKCRFVFGCFGPYLSELVMTNAKEIYVLKLGANPARIAPFWIAYVVAGPLLYLVAGRIMDHEPPLINWPGWGRRAPWFLLSLLLLALVCGLVFLPPHGMVEIWLGAALMLAMVGRTFVLNTFEAAYAEIYPYKEERAFVQGLLKLLGIGASCAAMAPMFVMLAVATLPVRILSSLFYVVCVLLSLEVVPVLKDARQPRSAKARTVSMQECWQVMRNPAMFHATMVRVWQGAADTTSLTFATYYLAFVCLFDGETYSSYFFLTAVIGVAMEIGLTGLWSWLWGAKPSSNPTSRLSILRSRFPSMRALCTAFHLCAVVVCPLVLWTLPRISPSVRPWEWILYFVLLRAFYSPQTFFRNCAFCLSVDEDCHTCEGRRREAVHAGVAKCFEELGRGLGACLFLGLGLAGLDVRNCSKLCESQADTLACIRECEVEEATRQPQAVADYIMAMHLFVVPVFGLLCAYHTWRFPIHGARLEELRRKQAVHFKVVQGQPSDSLQAPSVVPGVVLGMPMPPEFAADGELKES